MVVYSSEARGYAGMLLASVMGLNAVDRWKRGSGRFAALELLLATCLGMLSHATYVFAYAGTVAFSIAGVRHCADQRGATDESSSDTTSSDCLRSSQPAWWGVARLHLAPILMIALFYMNFYRNLGIGGGDLPSLAHVLSEAIAWSTGMATLAPALALFATIVLLASRFGRDDLTIFLLVAGVAAPVGLLTAQYLTGNVPPVIFTRYFLVSIFCFIVLTSLTLGRLLEARRPSLRAVGSVLLAVVLAGNASQIIPLLQTGRGHYGEALADIASLAPTGCIHIGGDHDFRAGMMIDFYAARVVPDHPVMYQSLATRPEWLILKTSADAIPFVAGYDQLLSYEHANPSGWGIDVYRRSR